jgi:rubrerythrin
MEATVVGPNRTGAMINPKGVDAMLEAVNDLSPPVPIATLSMDVERQKYIAEAESVGSIPPPKSATARKASRAAGVSGDTSMSILLDKLGERIAFERTGTRLYGALITKYLALTNAGEAELPPAAGIVGADGAAASDSSSGQAALETLRQIQSDELRHFQMLSAMVVELGGDPTAQTPCADVTAAASMGLMQVMTDPRTTLAQCLNTILTAELTDNAGWELLSELAESAGQNQLRDPFVQALAAEQQHLAIIQGWLKTLVTQAPGTLAV